MEHKCDKCDNRATYHLTEIDGETKVERHLCEECAANAGLAVKANFTVSQLLEELILHSGSRSELTCDVCGMTYGQFRQERRLGCPNDYDAFGDALTPVLQQFHDDATEHIGKVPHRAGGDQQKQTAILRLRTELKQAVAREDYERAAALRDQIHELEEV